MELYGQNDELPKRAKRARGLASNQRASRLNLGTGREIYLSEFIWRH